MFGLGSDTLNRVSKFHGGKDESMYRFIDSFTW